MLSRIPSWAVAVSGASLVVVAMVLSSMFLYQIRESIAEERSEIATTRGQINLLWDSHRLADNRSTSADIFVAGAFGGNSNSSFLLGQAAYQLRGAILAMWAASGEPVPDAPPENIQSFEASLRDGDLGAYAELKSEIDRLRLLSQQHINGFTSVVDSAESRIANLQTWESLTHLAYVFFNILGFIVAMAKDLPVWKDQQARRGLIEPVK